MKLGTFCTLAIICVLTGCSTPVAPPAIVLPDNVLGISMNRTKEDFIPTGDQISIGVIFSENTQTNLTYLRQYHNSAGTGFGKNLLVESIRDAYISTSDPRLAVDWLKASLRREFGQVKEYPDVLSLKAAKPDILVVVDFRFQLITSRNSEIKANVAAHFYDRSYNHLGTAKGIDEKILSPIWAGNKRTEEIVSDIYEQKKVQISALQKFDRSLKDLLAHKSDKI